MIENFSREVTVPKATVLGVAEEVSEALVNKTNADKESDTNIPPKPPRQRKNELLYNQLLQGKLVHLNQEIRHIKQVLMKYAHVFHDENVNKFKGTQVIEHYILVTDAKPIGNSLKESLRVEARNGNSTPRIFKTGVIRQSTSPLSVPALLVSKKVQMANQNIGFA